MPIDVEKYRCHVQSIDLPQDRKDQHIHLVYSIMESFVDRAFGIHPVQAGLGSGHQKLAESQARYAMIGVNSTKSETEKSVVTTTEEEEIP